MTNCSNCGHARETHYAPGSLPSSLNAPGGCVMLSGHDRCRCPGFGVKGYTAPPPLDPRDLCARCNHQASFHCPVFTEAEGTLMRCTRWGSNQADECECQDFTSRVPLVHRVDRTSPPCLCGHGARSHVGLSRCTSPHDKLDRVYDGPCTCREYKPRRGYRVSLSASTRPISGYLFGASLWHQPDIELWIVSDPDRNPVAFAMTLPMAHRIATALAELDADEDDPGPSENHPAAKATADDPLTRGMRNMLSAIEFAQVVDRSGIDHPVGDAAKHLADAFKGATSGRLFAIPEDTLTRYRFCGHAIAESGAQVPTYVNLDTGTVHVRPTEDSPAGRVDFDPILGTMRFTPDAE